MFSSWYFKETQGGDCCFPIGTLKGGRAVIIFLVVL